MSGTGDDNAAPSAADRPDRAASDPGAAERAVRALRVAGRLADAADLVDQLGPYGVADGEDATTSLGAAVLEAYADQLAPADPRAADAVYQRALPRATAPRRSRTPGRTPFPARSLGVPQP